MKTRRTISALCLLGTAIAASQAAVVSHYSFDSDYTDSSGNGNDGTLTDVDTLGNSGIITSAGNHVFGGGAMDFSDDRDFITIPSQTFGSGLAYTVAFWAQVDDADRTWNMVTGRPTDTNFFIALNGGPNNSRLRSSDSSAARQADFPTGVNDTLWHHHVVTASTTGDISYYLDGALVSTATGKQTGFIFASIGEAYTNASDFDFQGRIDEFWLLDETADATLVSNLFNTNTIDGVPEPSSMMLAGLALLGVLRRKR